MTYLSKAAVTLILISPFAVSNTMLFELGICAKNGDSLQRLVCYDKLAEKTKDSQPIPRAVQLQDPVQFTTTESFDSPSVMEQKLSSKTELVKPEQVVGSQKDRPKTVFSQTNTISKQQAIFGHERKEFNKDLINQIIAKIVKVKKNSYGNQIITLVNGQVWQQTGSTRLRLKKDQIVIIERGAMGSFFIGKENVNKRIRAKRID
ncbi:MAG: hypothetical protein ACJAV1_002913 [Paraglaciecola sp.]|jgi:hypothetical protein